MVTDVQLTGLISIFFNAAGCWL